MLFSASNIDISGRWMDGLMDGAGEYYITPPWMNNNVPRSRDDTRGTGAGRKLLEQGSQLAIFLYLLLDRGDRNSIP